MASRPLDRRHRQKRALGLIGVGSAMMLLGFILLPAGASAWWALLLAGVIVAGVGMKAFPGR